MAGLIEEILQRLEEEAPDEALRRRGRPRKEPPLADPIHGAEVERLRSEHIRLAGVAPEAMTDTEIIDINVWQSSGDPAKWPKARELIRASLAMWLKDKGREEGRRAWRRSQEDVCRRGRVQPK